jgi:hypothetical protein
MNVTLLVEEFTPAMAWARAKKQRRSLKWKLMGKSEKS